MNCFVSLMPLIDRDVVDRCGTFRILKVDVTSSNNELLCHYHMPLFGHIERCGPGHPSKSCLKINVTSSCNELFRHVRMSLMDSDVEWSGLILLLKVDVTASCQDLSRDGLTTIFDCEECQRTTV